MHTKVVAIFWRRRREYSSIYRLAKMCTEKYFYLLYRPSLLSEKYFIYVCYVTLYGRNVSCGIAPSCQKNILTYLEVYKSKDASNFTDSIVYICVSWMICCHM